MELTARGWGRDMGPNILVKADLFDKPTKSTIRRDEIAIKPRLSDNPKLNRSRVWIFFGKTNVHLTGNYFFELEFTRRDIARLFLETFSDVDVKTMLRILNNARPVKSRPKEKTKQVGVISPAATM